MLYKYNSSPALDMGNESFVEEAAQFLEDLWARRVQVSKIFAPRRVRISTYLNGGIRNNL